MEPKIKDYLQFESKLNQPFQGNLTRLPNAVADALSLTPHQKTVLAGTLLGDGSLKEPMGNYKNSRFQMKHSIYQIEWICWKANQLLTIVGKKPFAYQRELGPPVVDRTTGKKSKSNILYEKIRFQTRALRCLSEFQKELSTDNKLDFSKPWLHKYIDEEALMIWWLDDGGKQGKGNRDGKLATHGFAPDQLPYLQSLLVSKWNINTTIQSATTDTNTYFYLQLSPVNLRQLLLRIMRHIPVGSMLYKAVLEYDDVTAQQDWVCTMFREVKPELHADLTKLVGPCPPQESDKPTNK